MTNPLPSGILASVVGRSRPDIGGEAERSIAAVLKTVDRKIRGFESLSPRWANRAVARFGPDLTTCRFLGEVPEWTIGAAC